MDKKRCIAPKIDRLLEMFPVVAVIGIKQYKKSTLIHSLQPDWHYYDLERPDHYRLISEDPQGFFALRSDRTIIDEAQEFPDLFRVLRGVIDEDRSMTGRFLLTGSSSPGIVRELSESLAGRMATVELWPFKACEFFDRPLSGVYRLLSQSCSLDELAALDSGCSIQQISGHWLAGGYPEPRITSAVTPDFQPIWMDQYFSGYLHRDIQRLFPRINMHRYRLFIQALAHRSGTYINASEIARSLEISSVTAAEYLEILHEAFVWRNLRSFDKNPFKSVQKMSRGYFRDSGLLHAMLKIRTLDELLLHPVAGRSFESFMIEEIIRGFQCLMEPGIDWYYYRTRDRSEIDLVIEGSFGIVPFEIKLGRNVNRRMLMGLKKLVQDMNLPYGILVNNSDRIEMLDASIIQIPARFF